MAGPVQPDPAAPGHGESGPPAPPAPAGRFGPYTLDPDEYAFLVAVARRSGARVALEFGPGVSTYALLAAGCAVHTFEADPAHAAAARQEFGRFGPAVTVWDYDPAAAAVALPPALAGRRFDVAVVDGPPVEGPGAAAAPHGRRAAVTCAAAHADVVVLHDAKRSHEQGLAADLAKSGWSAELFDSRRGLAVLRRSDSRTGPPTRPDPAADDSIAAARAHHAAGRRADAEAACRRLLDRDPRDAAALHLLGLMAQSQGRPAVAVRLMRMAAQAAPGVADYRNSLGAALADAGKLADAADAFAEALRLRPAYPAAARNLASALARLGRWADAVDAYRRATALPGAGDEPAPGDDPRVWQELAAACSEAGDADGMVAGLRQAVALRPDDAGLHGGLVYALHYAGGYSPQTLLDETRAWSAIHCSAGFPACMQEPFVQAGKPALQSKLRVGYVSGDFRHHTRALFMEDVLAAHDPAAVEVYCYSDVVKPDAVTNRIRCHAHAWRDTHGLDDAGLADLIRSDRIDVLVELTGHMVGNRLLAFARKPAPVQVAYPGYPATTGVPAVDYLITDADRDPPGAERWYTEQLVRLPVTSQVYRPGDDAPAVAPEPPCVARGYVTFGCTNRPAKVTPAVAGLWGRILAAVPGGRLAVYDGGAGKDLGRLRDRLGGWGVPPDRIDLLPRLPRPQYLAQYGGIDVLLDTYPYNGHTTTLDGLWMGVPTVTLAGDTHLTREGLAALKLVGLEDLAAATPDGYVAAAVELAGDVGRLRRLRAELRPRMAASPLRDATRLARELEAAYRAMWGRWRAGRAGEHAGQGRDVESA